MPESSTALDQRLAMSINAARRRYVRAKRELPKFERGVEGFRRFPALPGATILLERQHREIAEARTALITELRQALAAAPWNAVLRAELADLVRDAG